MKLLSLITVTVAAVLLAISPPAFTGAQDPDPPRIVFEHVNVRLLDTRSGAKPGNGWSTTIDTSNHLTADAVDWEINVQVVQAASDGWIGVGGRSAVVYDSGRANTVLSVAPPFTGLDVTVNGGSAHVIVDLVKIVEVTSQPVDDCGSTVCP